MAIPITIPYCGVAPSPAELATRFNLDPILIVLLLGIAGWHLSTLRSDPRRRWALWGWAVAAAALVSPLCALSVALFSARVAQHMVLILGAAPLLALSLPHPGLRGARARLWGAALAFLLALWFWHMPVPYDATFLSVTAYWAMHCTLFASAVVLWRELLRGPRRHLVDAFVAGSLTSMQMGLLGAVLALAARPLYMYHLTTTQAWGLTPLQDQQLGGMLMWVPGILLFLWASVRSLERLRGAMPAYRAR